jgi:hypothetical protein
VKRKAKLVRSANFKPPLATPTEPEVKLEPIIVRSADLDPQAWAELNFGDLELGDLRRNQRAITIGAAFAANPGGSIPQLFERWSETKAAYTFFGNPAVTPDEIQVTHRDLVLERMGQPGFYLLLEDTSEMSWAGQQPRPGLGPVGESKDGKQGFLLHTTLAAKWPEEAQPKEPGRRPPVELLGIADQQAVVRQAAPAGETRRERLLRERESEVWEATTTRLGTAPPEPAIRWVRVCDRGADIYEFLLSCQQEGHGFVVRAAQDRALLDETGQVGGHLFETARAGAALGEFELELRARPGQAARTAHLSVSATRVCLRAPYRPGSGPGKLPPIECTVVRVWEGSPPAGVEPLEWILLCDAVVTSFEQAREVALQYAARWLVEEFHKALKTGLGAEKLQLEPGQSLMNAVALMSVVALRLLHLREVARRSPEAPAAHSGLSELELAVLEEKARRPLPTVRDVALALGKLGGHLNRKGDGLPGWITLWRGYLKLQALVEGVRLGHNLDRKLKKFR